MIRRVLEWLRTLGDPEEPPIPDEPWHYGVWSMYTSQASVLVIGDNAADSTRLKEPLRNVGFQVEVALTGPEAATQLQVRRPDMIVMDRSLPGKRGYGAVNRLGDDLETAIIPAIMTIASRCINPFWRIGDPHVSCNSPGPRSQT